ACAAGLALPKVCRRPRSSEWSSGVVSGFVGNFDDNANPPLVVRSRLEAVRRTIGLRQPVANVRQSDSGRQTAGKLRAVAVAVVGDLDPDRMGLALGGDPDVGAVLARRHRIFDGVFDQ